jgi:hypothetical protein
MLVHRDVITDHTKLISHMVLSGLTEACKSVVRDAQGKEDFDNMFDVRLTIQGEEVDLMKFCEEWQRQVGRMIKEQTHEIARDVLNIDELQDAVTSINQEFKRSVDETVRKKLGIPMTED